MIRAQSSETLANAGLREGLSMSTTEMQQNRIGNDRDRLANAGEGRSNTLKSLKEEKQKKETAQTGVTTVYHVYAPLICLILVYISLEFFLATSTLTWSTFWLSLVAFAALFGAIGVFISATYSKSYEKRLRIQIEDLNFEIELANYPTSDEEQKSERLFRRSEREVSKYYHLNLTENRVLLYIGILCIFVGLLIVALTLAMVFFGGKTPDFDVWTKGIVAVFGAVSGIMVNYVGAIYLKMYAQSVEAFGQFHGRLVRTHELFLANMLVTRIAKEEGSLDKGIGRQAMLAELAKDIAAGAVKGPSHP
jgi:hypothetical protein